MTFETTLFEAIEASNHWTIGTTGEIEVVQITTENVDLPEGTYQLELADTSLLWVKDQPVVIDQCGYANVVFETQDSELYHDTVPREAYSMRFQIQQTNVLTKDQLKNTN